MSKSTYIIKENIPGLNGGDGLMREHFHQAKRRKNGYYATILGQSKTQEKYKGQVRITYTCYRSVLMDWDNHCASFKHIGDALVDAGVITDDKPAVIVEFRPLQVKCKRIEQRAVIIIENYTALKTESCVKNFR